MKKNLVLLLSFISFIYFSALIFISFNNILLNDVLEALFETITIPLMILVVALVIISVQAWHKDKWAVNSNSFLSVLILTVTVALMLLATIFNV